MAEIGDNVWGVTANASVTPYSYTLFTNTTTNTTYGGTVGAPRQPPAPKDDDPITWLRRRIQEVQWVPA